MRFYLIRHPWTEFNVQKITQGWADSSLHPKGVEMAEQVANFLADKTISRIITSDLGRCVQTAQIVNKKLDLQIQKVDSLREQNLGKYNGMPKAMIKEEFNEHDFSAKPEGGETFLEMKERVLRYVKSLTEDAVLLVTHHGCFQSIMSEALQLGLNDEKCQTTPLTVCEFELRDDKIYLLARVDLDMRSFLEK